MPSTSSSEFQNSSTTPVRAGEERHDLDDERQVANKKDIGEKSWLAVDVDEATAKLKFMKVESRR